MSGIIKAKEPKKVDESEERARLQRERQALLSRSAFNRNTRTSGGAGVTSGAQTFRSTLGA